MPFKALNLAIEFCQATGQIQFKGHLKDQLLRASTSIALNLSEGNAKGSAKEKRNFFQTAYASLRECQTIFKLMNIQDEKVLTKADALGACLYRLVNSNLKDSPDWNKRPSKQ